MSIYSYPQSKVIDDVTFKRTAKGAVRAYIHARADVTQESIKATLKAFHDKNWEAIPFMLDDKPTLEVRGFKRDSEFITLLNEEKLVEGSPCITKEKSDNISWMDKLRKRTLQLSGATYVVGDWGFWDYGRTGGDKLVMAASVSYFLGTLSLLFYGRNDQSDIQVQDLAKDMERFLAEQKVKLSQDSALHKITEDKHKNFMQSAHEFFKRYPSEVFNTVTALAGVFIAASAYNKIRGLPKKMPGENAAIANDRRVGMLDIGLGTLTTASGIFGTAVKEKKHDPDDPPAKGLKGIWEKIREHPLAVTGVGYTISTLFHARSTFLDWRQAKSINDNTGLKIVHRRALFVVMAFVSEFLLAISSKGHGQGVQSDNSVNQSVIALGADMIAVQPEAVQEKLIDTLGAFLSGPDMLAMKDSEVKALLRKEVEAMRTNPWVQSMLPKKEAAEKPGLTTAAKRENTNWQTKIATAEPAMAGLSA